MKSFLRSVVLMSLFAGYSHPLSAQNAPAQVICLFEPMPELATGGGGRGVVLAIQRRLVYPPKALRAGATGRVFISFTITPSGRVQEISVLKSFRRDCGLAAVSAIRQLPRFKPRPKRDGNVRYVVPVTFNLIGVKPLISPPSRQEVKQAHRKAFQQRNPNP